MHKKSPRLHTLDPTKLDKFDVEELKRARVEVYGIFLDNSFGLQGLLSYDVRS